MNKEKQRLILSLALLVIAFISFPVNSQEEEGKLPEKVTVQSEEESQATTQSSEALPLTEEEINKLEESTKQTNQCLKECREMEGKIQQPTVQLQSLVKEQQNLQDQLFQVNDLYMKTVDSCKVPLFEDNKRKIILLGPKDINEPGIQEMGLIIPPECLQSIGQIKKDLASFLNHLAELLHKSDASQQMISKLEERRTECLKSCEEIGKDVQPISKKIKKLMEQGISPPSVVGALACYDAANERMKRRWKMAEEGKRVMERIIDSSEKVSQTLISHKPSLEGIPISRKTDWQKLGFSNIESITREIAPYSGGTYIPTSLEKPFKEMGIPPLSSLPKLVQKRDIPRFVKIVAPDTAVPNRPLSLSIFDENEVPLSGIVIETDTGQTFKSGEKGKVHIPSLSDESDMVVLRVPGTSSGTACIGYSQEMPDIPKLDAPLHVDPASAIVLLGSIAAIQGSGFDGFSESTEISIGGKRVSPFAESPLSLKYKIPEDINPGSYTVTISEKFKDSAIFPILCIKLDLMADGADLKKGEIIKGRINVEGTEKHLLVELINDSPSEISIDPNLVPVKGGRGEFEIKGLKPGPFRIRVGAVEFFRK